MQLICSIFLLMSLEINANYFWPYSPFSLMLPFGYIHKDHILEYDLPDHIYDTKGLFSDGLGAQSFTSLMADLCQDINRVS